MCTHVFDYPDDEIENYNMDGKTITGICRYCGRRNKSYGVKWSVPVMDRYYYGDPGSTPYRFSVLYY